VDGGSHQADEQAALRRVAMLAASGARPEEVFAAVAAEAGQLLPADATGVFRYDPHDTSTCVAEWNSASVGPPFTLGARYGLGGRNTLTLISRTGRPARVERTEPATDDILNFGRELRYSPVAGAPVTVDGRLWGAIVALAVAGTALPLNAEERLAQFAELAAITIASTQARMALSSFADEQAALRRVATLAATGAPPEEVFRAVSAEAQQLLSADITGIARYDPGGVSTSVGGLTPSGPSPMNGAVVQLGGRNVITLVFETGKPARLDSPEGTSGPVAELGLSLGFRSAVGAPITVDGRLWGVMLVISAARDAWPPDTEARLAGFTELVATAIADAQARAQLRDFAAEQAALGRVATLVARGAPPAEMFAAVAEEVGRLLQADCTVMSRYDPDGLNTTVGAWAVADLARPLPIGLRAKLGGRNMTTLVLQTRQPTRLDDYSAVSGEIGTLSREWDIRASVGAPIWVEGQLWGVIMAVSVAKPLPPGTEERLAGFTELAATAIANAEAQAALTASRARIVAAADQTRRRVERDLHDGAQQRLVSLALRLRAEQAALPPEAAEVAERLDAAVKAALGLQAELREISHGLYPAILAESGLRPALRLLARRSGFPVNVDVRVAERLAESVEAVAYYAVSEALTNVARHADATAAEVEVTAEDGVLRVRVRDDGRGGADFSRGSGLTEVKDRVEAFGGRVSLHSPRGAGTLVEITLPRSSDVRNLGSRMWRTWLTADTAVPPGGLSRCRSAPGSG
jgi:signal transduction histidine kinase